MWRETDGYVFSEAAIDGYAAHAFDGMSFGCAWQGGLDHSNRLLTHSIDIWGGIEHYSIAHSEFGTEFTKEFGPRPAISWTTDLAVATRFAGSNGYILEAKIPVGSILNPTWRGTAESEVLIANGVWAGLFFL